MRHAHPECCEAQTGTNAQVCEERHGSVDEAHGAEDVHWCWMGFLLAVAGRFVIAARANTTVQQSRHKQVGDDGDTHGHGVLRIRQIAESIKRGSWHFVLR